MRLMRNVDSCASLNSTAELDVKDPAKADASSTEELILTHHKKLCT
jgi:hypothetical protein